MGPDGAEARLGVVAWISCISASRGARLSPEGAWRPARRAGITAATWRKAGAATRPAASAAARASSASHSRISISKMAHQNSAMKLAQLTAAPAAGRISAALAASLPARGAKDMGVGMTANV